MSDMANILIGIFGLILVCLVPAVGGLLGIVIKLWVDQAKHATRLALLEGNEKTGATILRLSLIHI